MAKPGIKIEFKGVEKVQKKLMRIIDKTDKAIDRRLPIAIMQIHADAVKSIQAKSPSGEGEWRYSGGHKRSVSPAKPGYPPNTDTGTLVNSIQFEYKKKKNEGAVGTNLEYGKFLELGTKKMKARPWLWPAYKKHKKKIPKELESALVNTVYKKESK